MSKILVTGASGFIGKHLVRELSSHGHEVFGIDIENGDLLTPGTFRSFAEDIKPEIVVHLAAQVGRLFGEDDLIHTVNSNALMTTIVAKACSDLDIRLVYVSTSEVYGDQGEQTCYEEGELVLSHNLYGVTKFWGEQVAALYSDCGLQVVRLSMPFGPGMVPGRGRAAIVNMLWQANTGQKITVHRNSERSWCWVGDTVAGIRLVIQRGDVAIGAKEWQDGIAIYNIGRDDNAVSMHGIALNAVELASAEYSLITEVDPPPMQTVVKRLDTSRLRALGWEPTVEIWDGMCRTMEVVQWFDAEGNWAAPISFYDSVGIAMGSVVL
jgi:nucleoside-diphosphate-sugar epimerase